MTPPLTTARIGPRESINIGRRRRDLIWDRLIVPTLIIDHTELAFRQGGVAFEETFLVWAGTIAGDLAIVSTIVIPETEANATHGFVTDDAVAAIHEALDHHDLVPLAQVHSHPRRAFLSATDRITPIASQAGFLSIVAARFGFTDMSDVTTWSIHEFVGSGGWRELAPPEVAERIVVDPSFLVVG